MHKGSCLCGAVSFEVAAELATVDACHCSQCRKQSGHFWVSTDAPRDAVTISGAEALTWYKASDGVRRGFCSTCGSFLFWDPIGKDRIGVAMGAFEKPTGARITEHIFVADKAIITRSPTVCRSGRNDPGDTPRPSAAALFLSG